MWCTLCSNILELFNFEIGVREKNLQRLGWWLLSLFAASHNPQSGLPCPSLCECICFIIIEYAKFMRHSETNESAWERYTIFKRLDWIHWNLETFPPLLHRTRTKFRFIAHQIYYCNVRWFDSIRFDSLRCSNLPKNKFKKESHMWRYRHVSDILEAKDEYKTAKNEKKYWIASHALYCIAIVAEFVLSTQTWIRTKGK